MARPAETSEPPAGAPRGGSTAHRRIEDEHRRLNELLRSLTHGHDPNRLLSLVDELKALLVEHFDHEEEPEGLHQIVGEGAAHRLPNLQRLFEEHRQILATVEALERRLGELVDGPWREVREAIASIAETLRRHESAEEDLFSEAFYLDIGGRS